MTPAETGIAFAPFIAYFLPAEQSTRMLSALSFNYERFNHSNFNIHYWSWNYRGCWHQTCPPIDFFREFTSKSFLQVTPRGAKSYLSSLPLRVESG